MDAGRARGRHYAGLVVAIGIAGGAVAALLWTSAGGVGPAAVADTATLSPVEVTGFTDPYKPTAVAVGMSQQLFPDGGAEDIILTRDTPSADALAAGALIGVFDTTVLLTDSETLTPATAAEIDRLGQPNVHILGGENAISIETEQLLIDNGHDVHRHAGAYQADTAVDIASRHFSDVRTAVLVPAPDRGEDSIAALTSTVAASSLAAARELPLLLTDKDRLTPSTRAYLEASSIQQLVVVADDDVLDQQVLDELNELNLEWDRWGGVGRFDTAVVVARNSGHLTLEDAEVAVLVEGVRDTVWPGGFLGAVLAAQDAGPVLLTNDDELPYATTNYLSTAATGAVEILCTPGVSESACRTAQTLVDAK